MASRLGDHWMGRRRSEGEREGSRAQSRSGGIEVLGAGAGGGRERRNHERGIICYRVQREWSGGRVGRSPANECVKGSRLTYGVVIVAVFVVCSERMESGLMKAM